MFKKISQQRSKRSTLQTRSVGDLPTTSSHSAVNSFKRMLARAASPRSPADARTPATLSRRSAASAGGSATARAGGSATARAGGGATARAVASATASSASVGGGGIVGTPPSTVTYTPRHHRPRSRNHTLANSLPPAVLIKTYDMLNPQERRFLEAAEKGDRPTLIACLSQKNVPLNLNAVDAMGRTAIEIAVDNENIEIVELLLQQDSIRIGNALLCAIREGVYTLVEMLVNHPSITKDMLGDGWSKYLDASETATSEYSSDISPVVLAAHLNRFEILAMLLRKDAKIEKPHKHSCTCEDCDRERLNDSLHYSLKRINTYRALASPAWMSLTSSDPILSAFKLSWELQKLSRLESEFKDTYVQLSEQCKQYACDLLSQCRSTEEVIAVLNKEDNVHDENIDVWASKLSLSRLKRAIKYEQKMFVSHPHCQQLLTSIWYEGYPVRQQRGSKWNLVICTILALLWPLLAICYVIMPKSRIGRIMRSPFMKFLYYSISFGCFLLLLTLVTFETYRTETGEIKGGGKNRTSDRGPPPTLIEWLVLLWIIGMLWSEVKQIWEEGFTKYVYQWWNWLDFIMICLYLCTISLRLSAYSIYTLQNDGGYTPRHVIRTHWDAYEPMLVSEALFAVGNVFSFGRIIYLFQTNPYLGPLQISLGCMLIDVAKFSVIFGLIITSFTIGLAQLYWYYDAQTPVCIAPDSCKLAPNPFSSIHNSYMTLLWSLFSITKVEDTDVVEDHYFTQWVGRGMFLMYHVTSIIVLLNMLIAMMSHSFQIINDHADLEWKFHRTKLWMAHFDEGSSLAPPFNIIITPKACYYAFCAMVNFVKWLFGRYHTTKSRTRATIRRPGYSRKSKEMEKNAAAMAAALNNNSSFNNKDATTINMEGEMTSTIAPVTRTPTPNAPSPSPPLPSADAAQILASGIPPPVLPKQPLTYANIIQRLVSRFIHETKKSMKMDGVNEDDLLEIKQDISSLRFELRDDRRKEIVRSSSHIDAVKRDIMRTMSSTTRMFGGAGGRVRPSAVAPPPHRASVAEEEEDGGGGGNNYFDDDSDVDIKSQGDSVYTTAGGLISPTISYGLPSITVGPETGTHFVFGESHSKTFRTRSTKSTVGGSKSLLARSSGAAIDFARRRAIAQRESGLVSAFKQPPKVPLGAQKSAPVLSVAVPNVGAERAVRVADSALSAVRELRGIFNAQLDAICEQISTASVGFDEDVMAGGLLPGPSQSAVLLSPPGADAHRRLCASPPADASPTMTRPHTPLSAPARSVSPSRVSFASARTTICGHSPDEDDTDQDADSDVG